MLKDREEQQSADWLLPLGYLSSCPSRRGKPRVLVHLCHISVYTCVSYSFFSRLQGLLIAFKSRIHQDSAEELCVIFYEKYIKSMNLLREKSKNMMQKDGVVSSGEKSIWPVVFPEKN